MSGKWYILLPDNSYSFVAETNTDETLSIAQYLAYSSIVFYCMTDYGTAKYELVQTDDSDVSVIFSGDDPYNYDANGDIAFERYEQERVLKATVSWAEGKIVPYDTEWYLNGNKITDTMTDSNSMLEKVWVDDSKNLHYNIRQKYRNNSKNIAELRLVSRLSDESWSFKREIVFTKDGDQGTNGTTFVLVVRPYENGIRVAGYNPLIQGTAKASQNLKAVVYRDGEIYDDVSSYSLSVVNAKGTQVGDTITITCTSASVNGVVVYATATLSDGTILTASYPVPYQTATSEVEISGLPQYIQYTSSGVAPLYAREDIVFKVDGVDYDDIITSPSDLISLNSDKTRIKPAAAFDGSTGSVALVTLTNSDITVYWPICYYLNKYGNEAINGWDGVSVDTSNGKVLAPQIGAGKKDPNTNVFTGVIMGKSTAADPVSNRTGLQGLYGYQGGVNTFGLTENGDAYFGVGGKIKFSGSEATITGMNGGNSELGMTIDLNGTKSSDIAIKVGGGKFKVGYDGTMNASAVNITGGSLNINNKFIVASDGNVTTAGDLTLGGNIKMTGSITWGSSSSPVKAQYSVSGSSWHDTFNSSSDYYARYSYDGGQTWTSAVKIQGKDGQDGQNGTSANVTFNNVNNALGNLFARSGSSTYIDEATIYSPTVNGGVFYGSSFYAGQGSGYASMESTGFKVYNAAGENKINLSYLDAGGVSYPYLVLGIGNNYGTSSATILKLGNGLWLGSSTTSNTGDEPSSGTGIFINFFDRTIYQYKNGTKSEFGSGGGGTGGTATAVFG